MLIIVKDKTCGVVKALARYEVSLRSVLHASYLSLLGNIVPWPEHSNS